MCLALLLPVAIADAASTTAWEMSSYEDFLRGRFSGVSLSRDGRLRLAPKLQTVFSSDQPVIWSVARAADGTLYAGSGHRGQVFRIAPSGQSSVLWTAAEPEVFAVALDVKGRLYAATSPNGKIYRIEDGKAAEFFSPGATYIWSLAFDNDGVLYVGTGDQGRIYRVEASGKGELFYETGQSHVMCLALDSEGRLLAGTEPNGILYRVSGKGKAFVLYDADLPEIRSIAATEDGTVYIAAQGGGVLRRGPAGTQPAPGGTAAPAGASSTTITVEAQGGVEIKPKPEAAKPAQPAATPQVTTQFTPVLEVAGVEKSALYRISPDHTVETLWSSKEENVYDLLPQGREVIFATDGQGRIYRLGPDRKVTLLVQTNESEATRLLGSGEGLLASTGNLGKIFRLAEGPGTNGVYESPVHDANTVARWGRLNWRSESCAGCRVTFRTRSGNSARPDKTWSDWSEPLAESNGSAIRSPNARYIQWKVELSGSGEQTPVLDSVALAYLPQNTPPVLRNITVTTQMTAAGAARPVPSQSASGAYSITVTDTGESAQATSSGTPTQALQRPGSRQLQITWQADDADGDRLVYELHFRGEDESEWKLVKDHLYETTCQVDGEAFADGRYYFKVKASDLPNNPAGRARESELVSAPVLVDNTPPVVTPGIPKQMGPHYEVEFEAADAAGPLRRAEYSVDAGYWTPVEAADGVIDSPRERFVVRLENVPPGEHLVVLRVYDAADNAGLAKVVLR